MKVANLARRLSGLRPRWNFAGQITLGAPALLALGALALISLGWAFYMGLLVGRDEQPQEAVPALGELFHKDIVPARERPAMQEKAETEPVAAMTDSQPPVAPQPQSPAMSAEAASAWPVQHGATPTPQPAASAEARKPRQYQIAAFRTAGEASALASRIRIPGLKTRVEPAGRVFLVIGSGRLSDSETEAMRESLAAMGLGAPLPLVRKQALQKSASHTPKAPAGRTADARKAAPKKQAAARGGNAGAKQGNKKNQGNKNRTGRAQ